MKRVGILVVLTFLVVVGAIGPVWSQATATDYGMTGPLPCGWNMLGFPIDSPTAIASFQVRDTAGTVLSMAAALQEGWLQLPAFTYASGGYVTCGVELWDDDSSFRPWTGYWINVLRCGIQIICPVPIKFPFGSGVQLSTDQPSYSWCAVCDVIPQPVKMRFVVFNTTCLPVTYTFSTCQEFDFAIFDPAGRKIWQWSDGRQFCLPIIPIRITLNACSANPVDRVCIVGYAEWLPKSLLIPAGLYTLKGWLTTDRTMEATITFEVR